MADDEITEELNEVINDAPIVRLEQKITPRQTLMQECYEWATNEFVCYRYANQLFLEAKIMTREHEDAKGKKTIEEVAQENPRFQALGFRPLATVDLDGVILLEAEQDGKIERLSIHDWKLRLREYTTLSTDLKCVDTYLRNFVKNHEPKIVHSSEIYVDSDGIMKVDYDSGVLVEDTLKLVRDFYLKATHPHAFAGMFGWSLMEPWFYNLKANGHMSIQAPQILFDGVSKAGKTPIQEAFIVKGFNQTDSGAYYHRNRSKRDFTKTKQTTFTNKPGIQDEIDQEWLDNWLMIFKAYSQTNDIASSGRSDRTMYDDEGKRTYALASNENLDLAKNEAGKNRTIRFSFRQRERLRVDKKAWDTFYNSLPMGFLMDIMRELFDGKNVNDLYSEASKFRDKMSWIDYAIDAVNELLESYDLEPFPEVIEDVDEEESDVFNVAYALLTEWDKLHASDNYVDPQDGSTVIRKKKYTLIWMNLTSMWMTKKMASILILWLTPIRQSAGKRAIISSGQPLPIGSITYLRTG